MIALHRKKRSSSERGFALIIAMLVLLLITAIGMGMLLAATTETSISSNFRDEQVSFFAAKAGLEEVRDRLRPSAPNSLSALLPTSVAGSNNAVLYVTNPLAVTDPVSPWNTGATGNIGNAFAYGRANGYPDNGICNRMPCPGGVAGTGWYTATTASAAYAASPPLPWKWVRVVAKTNTATSNATGVLSVDGANQALRVCWNGANEVTIGNGFTSCPVANAGYMPVYELTALAVTPSGSRRMLQAELSSNPPLAFPAALGIVSGGQTQCQMQGGTVSGIDQAVPAGASVPGIAYSGAGTCATQGTTITGGGACTATPNVCGNMPMGGFAPGATLANTITTIIGQADNIYTGNVPAPQSTNGTLGVCPNSPKTTVVNTTGALFTGVTGCGILLINSGMQTQLEIAGDLNWMGPVIVYSSAGQVQVQIDTGTGRILGALMMASNSNAQVQFQFQGTGLAGGILYSSYYNSIFNNSPFKTISVREVNQ